jgi:hypothetical protein
VWEERENKGAEEQRSRGSRGSRGAGEEGTFEDREENFPITFSPITNHQSPMGVAWKKQLI